MTPSSRRFLDRLVATACTDLFSAYGVSVDRKAALPAVPASQPLDHSSGGIIRFGGEKLSGSLFVVGTFNFLSACRPQALRAKALTVSSVTDWIFVRDWSMEVTNQVLGRIRNQLYGYGVTLEVRAPTAVSGHPLALTMRGRTSEPVCFAMKSGDAMMVWLDAVAEEAFDEAVSRKPSSVPAVPREGEVLEF